MLPAWGRSFDKLVEDRAMRVDDFQQKGKHNPLEKGKRVGRGSQGLRLAKQMGVSAWEEINPCNVIVVTTFDGSED